MSSDNPLPGQLSPDPDAILDPSATPANAAGAGATAGATPPTAATPDRAVRGRRRSVRLPWLDVAVTAGAFVLAFLIGAILMIVADPEITGKYAYFFSRPGDALGASGAKVAHAYAALAAGAAGGWVPFTESCAQAAPLIVAGLGVGLAFRAGLFNIGAQGQATFGAIFAAYAGFSWHLPTGLHLLVAIAFGMAAGALWGGLAGWLKARFGAHEVIVTIMLNYVATGMLAWLLSTRPFLQPGRSDPISPIVDWSAQMPRLEGSRLDLGFFIALGLAVFVWWLLDRSTIGFAIRAVGKNANAAKTAGMSVARTLIVTMLVSGALAGFGGVLAATSPTSGGTPVPLSNGIVGTIGFDAITVALLGRSKPLGIVLAGLLFGAMHAGGLNMQSAAQTPLELTTVLQALIVMFVAAPRLVQTLLPFLRARAKSAQKQEVAA